MRKLLLLLIPFILTAQIEDGWDNSNFGISGTLTVSELIADNFGENVLIVGTDTEFEYNNVDDAINDAADGDIILVLPGTYTGFIDAESSTVTTSGTLFDRQINAVFVQSAGSSVNGSMSIDVSTDDGTTFGVTGQSIGSWTTVVGSTIALKINLAKIKM